MKAKQIIALLLASIMLSSALMSCSDATETEAETVTSDNTGAVTADTADTSEAETAEAEEEDPASSWTAEQRNFDGYTYNVFVQSVVGNDFDAEELTGEAMNDAEYQRLIVTKEYCNIDITYVPFTNGMSDGQTPLKEAVMAGTNDYDLVSMSAYSMMAAIPEKLLYNLNSISTLDFTKSWWDQGIVDDFTFGDRLYIMNGDISVQENNNTFCIYFNKQLAEDYGLPNLYELVNDMKWTIDALKTAATDFGGDTDNDGNHVNDVDDSYPIWMWDDCMMGIVNAGGIKCAEINSEGDVELTLYSEKFVNLIEKFESFAFDTEITCAYQRTSGNGDGYIEFSENRAMFLLSGLFHARLLRDMETDFGILPFPLYDEDQDRYYNSIASYGCGFYAIPRNTWTGDEFERSGYVAEFLGYQGLKLLTPAYYDQTLQGKITRDEESSAMLDLIFSTRTYDIGWYLQVGTLNDGMMNLFRNYSTDVTSMYKRLSKVADKQLEKFNKNLDELDTYN